MRQNSFIIYNSYITCSGGILNVCLSQCNLLEFQNEGNDALIVLALMYDMYDMVASLVRQIATAIN